MIFLALLLIPVAFVIGKLVGRMEGYDEFEKVYEPVLTRWKIECMDAAIKEQNPAPDAEEKP